MAEQSTFIKIDRNILRWRWWKNHNTLIVFLWLLLNANVVDREFEHEVIKRGQVATSIKSIANANSLTTQQVRTSILHLKSTGEITIKSTNRYQVITISNYESYQNKTTNKTTKTSTGNQQTDNKQITNNQQQYKNIKNIKNERKNKPPKSPTGGQSPFGEFKRGTDEFRNRSHLLLKRDEGTVDDIPMVYRDGTYQSFKSFQEYYDWRNQ